MPKNLQRGHGCIVLQAWMCALVRGPHVSRWRVAIPERGEMEVSSPRLTTDPTAFLRSTQQQREQRPREQGCFMRTSLPLFPRGVGDRSIAGRREREREMPIIASEVDVMSKEGKEILFYFNFRFALLSPRLYLTEIYY
ncbi:hypothetical protein BT93_I1184 [Corymbia citriodora subsp. variegata]|nr:hypothetical protein BT93_I1184 [Corymbia citriodora subsp. variegata]